MQSEYKILTIIFVPYYQRQPRQMIKQQNPQ